MDYFSRFPKVFLSGPNNEPILITDFLRSVNINSAYKNNLIFLNDYLVKDGETPEIVSNNIYNSPRYHWVLLLINSITNPREEWPISNKKVSEMIFDKYDFLVEVPDGTEYTKDDDIEADTGATFKVTKVMDDVVYLRSQVGPTELEATTLLNNLTTEVEDLTIENVTGPKEATHHFYDEDLGLIVDEGFSPSTISVSNLIYEIDVNDKKREIKILQPELLGNFLTQFNNLIK